jgi:hypothetical protein
VLNGPTTPSPQPLPGITWKRFSLLRFRSPLLTESLIAASYVLHRLLVPRHPPCALNNLATQLQQTPRNIRPHPALPPRRAEDHGAAGVSRGPAIKEDARVHCAVLNVQPATIQTPPPPNPIRHRLHEHGEPDGWCEDPNGPDTSSRPPPADASRPRPEPAPSGPNSVPTTPHPSPPRSPPTPRSGPYLEPAAAGGRTGQRSTLEHHPRNQRPIGSDEPSRPERGSAPPAPRGTGGEDAP